MRLLFQILLLIALFGAVSFAAKEAEESFDDEEFDESKRKRKIETERERGRERDIEMQMGTHTHTHTDR